jgi:hypothetical protein
VGYAHQNRVLSLSNIVMASDPQQEATEQYRPRAAYPPYPPLFDRPLMGLLREIGYVVAGVILLVCAANYGPHESLGGGLAIAAGFCVLAAALVYCVGRMKDG